MIQHLEMELGVSSNHKRDRLDLSSALEKAGLAVLGKQRLETDTPPNTTAPERQLILALAAFVVLKDNHLGERKLKGNLSGLGLLSEVRVALCYYLENEEIEIEDKQRVAEDVLTLLAGEPSNFRSRLQMLND